MANDNFALGMGVVAGLGYLFTRMKDDKEEFREEEWSPRFYRKRKALKKARKQIHDAELVYRKYKGRKGPAISATSVKRGTRRRGNDGKMWVVRKSGKSQRWFKDAESFEAEVMSWDEMKNHKMTYNQMHNVIQSLKVGDTVSIISHNMWDSHGDWVSQEKEVIGVSRGRGIKADGNIITLQGGIRLTPQKYGTFLQKRTVSYQPPMAAVNKLRATHIVAIKKMSKWAIPYTSYRAESFEADYYPYTWNTGQKCESCNKGEIIETEHAYKSSTLSCDKCDYSEHVIWDTESFEAEDCKNVKAFVGYTCVKCDGKRGFFEVEDGNFYRFAPDIGDCSCGGFEVNSNEFITCQECDDYFHHRGDGWAEHLRIIMDRKDAESFDYEEYEEWISVDAWDEGDILEIKLVSPARGEFIWTPKNNVYCSFSIGHHGRRRGCLITSDGVRYHLVGNSLVCDRNNQTISGRTQGSGFPVTVTFGNIQKFHRSCSMIEDKFNAESFEAEGNKCPDCQVPLSNTNIDSYCGLGGGLSCGKCFECCGGEVSPSGTWVCGVFFGAESFEAEGVDLEEYEQMTWETPSDELEDAVENLIAEVKRVTLQLAIAEEVLSMSDAVQTYNKILLQELGIDRYADDFEAESFGAEDIDDYIERIFTFIDEKVGTEYFGSIEDEEEVIRFKQAFMDKFNEIEEPPIMDWNEILSAESFEAPTEFSTQYLDQKAAHLYRKQGGKPHGSSIKSHLEYLSVLNDKDYNELREIYRKLGESNLKNAKSYHKMYIGMEERNAESFDAENTLCQRCGVEYAEAIKPMSLCRDCYIYYAESFEADEGDEI